MEKKIAVVTGATSVAINALIDLLVNSNFQVIAVSRNIRQSETRKQVKWVVCDLASCSPDLTFLENTDLLVHAASISNAYTRAEFFHNNIQSTINLVEAAKKYQVKKIVYISSILAGEKYGDYGHSKFQSEGYLRNNFNNWLIIRPSQLYGYSRNPVDKLIEAIAKKKILFCPVGDQNGIYPLHFNDLVQHIFTLSVDKKRTNIIEIITGPKKYNYKGMVHEIANILNREPWIIPVPKVIMLMVYHILKTTRLKLGIYPDQIYRFYHNYHSEVNSIQQTISLSDYLTRKMNQ